MKRNDGRAEFSPSALDFSQEASAFRQELRGRFLATAGYSTALSDDELDGLNAAGGYPHLSLRDSKRRD